MTAPKAEAVERLVRLGFASNRLAVEFREVRERFGITDDLSNRLRALEEEAAILRDELAARLRDLDEAAHVYVASTPA